MDSILPVIVLILVLGMGAQILAEHVKIPSVLFLIVIGVVLGPAGLNLISIETFGTGLSTVVGLSVAVILFDGAFQMKLQKLRSATAAILRLTTVGALIAFLGTASAVRVFLDTDWSIAFLIGALLIATGPTVITPILEVITVREHVAAALEAEGIINDVTAALLAIVIFEVAIIGTNTVSIPVGFLQRLTIGVSIGIGLALGVRYLLISRRLTAVEGPRIARFVTFSGVLLTYGIAETIMPETGVAAAAAFGFILGNIDLPHRETIAEFHRDVTLVALSFVFISLAALIQFDTIRALGMGGVAVVVAVILVIRPFLVLLSARDPRFSRGERYFLSLVGPRGIIPASVATLFALQLELAGQFQAARTLAGTVFLVIFITVILQAGLARHIAEYFHVEPMRTIIVGGGRVGRALATRLEKRAENVILIDSDRATVDRLRSDGFTVVEGDGTDIETLRDAGIQNAKIVVTATADDDTNLLVSQLAVTKFGVGTVVARVNRPDNVTAFDALDVRAIDVSSATAWSLDNEIERPALAHWMTELGEGHDAQEIVVTADDLSGMKIRELDAEIPDGCIVAVIARNGETEVPTADTILETGDRITFIGREEAVRRAVDRFHPHD